MKTNKKKTSGVSKKNTKELKVNIKVTEAAPSSANLKPIPACIFITGESPMVEQYAELCIAHGYDVSISWNERLAQNPKFKSDGIKITNIIPANTSLAIELTNIDPLAKKKNIERFDKALAETAPILSSSITVTATEQSSWISGKHRLVGIAALPTLILKPLVEIAPTIYSPKETLEVTKRFFQSIGKEIEIVQDRIGMVLPRMLCRIINEAAFAITEDIATPQDIDTALKLGVNFPFGPFEWAEQIGLKQVYAVLMALHTDLQEERYRVTPLLKQMAITRK
ncbi:MAG: 3-hydroxyacyl-CoA dehydrogenase family protein [Bacteroidota bacterium]